MKVFSLQKVDGLFSSLCEVPAGSRCPLTEKVSHWTLSKSGEDRIIAVFLHGLFELFQRRGWADESPQSYDYDSGVINIKKELVDAFGVVGKVSGDKPIIDGFHETEFSREQIEPFISKFFELFRSHLPPKQRWKRLALYFPEKVSQGVRVVRGRSKPKRREKLFRYEDFRLPILKFPRPESKDQRPYLEYWALTDEGYTNPAVPLKRKIERCPKRFQKRREVRKWFDEMKADIDEALKSGWSPFLDKSLWPTIHRKEEKGANGEMLLPRLQKIVEFKNSQFPKSAIIRRSHLKMLKEYLGAKQLENVHIGGSKGRQFNREDAMNFVTWVQQTKSINPNTLNSQLGMIRSFFSELVKSDVIAKNPFASLKVKQKKLGQKNSFFSREEGKKLMPWLEKHRPDLHLLVNCMYFGCLRNADLGVLKGSNFDFEKKEIFLAADEASKTGIEKTLVMLPEFEKVLRKHGIDKLGPDDRMAVTHNLGQMAKFFFPSTWKPTLAKLRVLMPDLSDEQRKAKLKKWKINHEFESRPMSIQHKGILIDLDLTRKGGDVPTFYSWKHTGVCSYLDAGYDLLFVKRQCGHTQITNTEAYLNKMPRDRSKLYNVIPQRKSTR